MGQVTTFVSDPELVSSVGIEVDESRDRLLVANSDRAVFQGETAGVATDNQVSLLHLFDDVSLVNDDATRVLCELPAGAYSWTGPPECDRSLVQNPDRDGSHGTLYDPSRS